MSESPPTTDAHPSLEASPGGCVVDPSPPTRAATRAQKDWELWISLEPCHETRQHNVGRNDGARSPPAPPPPPAAEAAPTTHTGGCHCGRVRFRCVTPTPRLVVLDCNCSDCRLRRNVHFIVPGRDLTIVRGLDNLAEYRWGTCAARHLFCATCGITPLYVPRSNPDGWAVTFAALDAGTVEDVAVRRFDGRNWEEHMEGEGGDVREMSQPPS